MTDCLEIRAPFLEANGRSYFRGHFVPALYRQGEYQHARARWMPSHNGKKRMRVYYRNAPANTFEVTVVKA